MKPSVFVASSNEKNDVAEAILLNLSAVAEVSHWKHSFRPGQTFFSELLNLKDRFDFAVIVLSADDIVKRRGEEYHVPRDNLVFELGLFLGSIGPDRVFAVVDKSVDTKLMSDYSGVGVLGYNGERPDGDLNQALSLPCVEIKQAIAKVGIRRDDAQTDLKLFPGVMIGLEKIHENWELAEQRLLNDLRTDPGPIRLFFHIASKNIGLSGSLFDVIESIVQEGRVDIRILHASAESPLFARDRLISLGKKPERVLASLKHVNDSLQELESVAKSSLRRRTHDYPFLWRVYGLSNRLYFMPYFSNKDATMISPVLVFEKNEKSLYHTFTAWFDDVWSRSAPQRVRITDLISSAAPSGAAIFLQWEGRHVLGVPKRDVIEERSVVRLYGLGGKRQSPAESFELCALREGNEELNGTVESLISSKTTDYFRADGAISPVVVTGEDIVPRLILEKREHTGRGSMKRGDDIYYLVAYDAKLSGTPIPTGELGAVLLLDERCLKAFAERGNMTLTELLALGALIEEQAGFTIPREAIMSPLGTAQYLIRSTL